MIEKGCAECGVKASDGYALYCVKCSELMRDWVELTDDEMSDTYNFLYHGYVSDYVSKEISIVDFIVIARAIEAQLKEKNHD